jgi:hypothetical protein
MGTDPFQTFQSFQPFQSFKASRQFKVQSDLEAGSNSSSRFNRSIASLSSYIVPDVPDCPHHDLFFSADDR